jgi:hypothetical protein
MIYLFLTCIGLFALVVWQQVHIRALLREGREDRNAAELRLLAANRPEAAVRVESLESGTRGSVYYIDEAEEIRLQRET